MLEVYLAYIGGMLGLCWRYVWLMLGVCLSYVGGMFGLCWGHVRLMLGRVLIVLRITYRSK